MAVIRWFKQLEGKEKRKFFKFDIVSYYPSISIKLLNDAIDWAMEITTVTETERAIIMNARKSFIFKEGESWYKKDAERNEDLFDCPMGAYDSAEASDLVGLFLLSELNKVMDIGDGGI